MTKLKNVGWDIGKEKPKNHGPTFIIKDFKDKENSSSKNKAYIQNKLLNQSIRTNIKNHTKMNDKKNPVKILDKKTNNKFGVRAISYSNTLGQPKKADYVNSSKINYVSLIGLCCLLILLF